MKKVVANKLEADEQEEADNTERADNRANAKKAAAGKLDAGAVRVVAHLIKEVRASCYAATLLVVLHGHTVFPAT